MAILRSHGVLLVDAIPTHAPTAEQARLARLENTLTFFVYNGSAWVTIRLDAPETYTGNIIPDNVSLGVALQSLETAIEAISQDGNHELISRGNATEDVAPTAGEIASPVNGDTADVLLSNGKVEKWAYTGGSWTKAFTIDYTDVTNLAYTASATQGVVTSSNGTDATIPAVDNTNAGLMTSALLALLNSAVQGVTDSNTIDFTKTGNDISGNVKISASQGAGVAVTAEADGIKVEYTETEPTAYLSKAEATTALGGTGKKFQYAAANLDGAVEGSVAWT